MDRMEPPRLPEDRYRMTAPTLGGFAGAAAILMAAAVIVGSARHVLPESVAILLFLTAVLISAAGFGFWVGIISAVGALAGFNFMYVEPHFTLHIARPQDIIKLYERFRASGSRWAAGRLAALGVVLPQPGRLS